LVLYRTFGRCEYFLSNIIFRILKRGEKMDLNLQKYIGQITGQMQPMLDAFLKALGIRTEREQTKTLQKAQQMGRVTTGHLPEMQREVREEAGMEEAQFRGGYAQNIMQYAMQLFGLESEYAQFQEEMKWREQQAELDRALQRELAKMGGAGGITFPESTGITGVDKFPDPDIIPQAVNIPSGGIGISGALSKFVKPVPTKPYQPTQKATTTYRGARLGRI